MRLLSSHSRLLRIAVAAIGLGVAFHAAHALFGLGGHRLDGFSKDWVYTAVELVAAAVCAARVIRRREDRWAWGLVTFALAGWFAGDLIWTLWLNDLAVPPYPSVADAAYLSMHPAICLALMLLIRTHFRRSGLAQWLDGGVVGLTVAAIGSGLVLPSILAVSRGRFIEDAINLAYPILDLTLLAFVLVAFCLAGWRPGRVWVLLGAGIALMAAADLVFVYTEAGAAYVAGGILDTLWPAAMSLFALAAWQPARGRGPEAILTPETLALPMIAAALALALLVDAAFHKVAAASVALAAGALLLMTLRGSLSYLENLRMLRRSAEEAITDGLSGLGNRPRLLHDLDAAVARTRDAGPVTLAFCDLNGFKRYNDSFGHAAGDALLARLGAALLGAGEGLGHAYRLGGDEFCVLLRGRFNRRSPEVGALAAALTEQGSGFAVTASYGLAVVPDDAATGSAALQLADQRMYADKTRSSRAGRQRTRDVLMQILTERTPELHQHCGDVGRLARGTARYFPLDSEQLDELLRAAELHDVGKLAIPDEILERPGPLTAAEWQFMREHPLIGERILNVDPALRPVARLVRSSHERWDGGGYPDGLAAAAIPLGARIIAACDAFEAMTSDRCYQPRRSTEEATAELRRHAGTQFDPEVVRALCAHLAERHTGELPLVGARRPLDHLGSRAPADPR